MAVQASQQCFRQSVPYAQLQTARKSIGLTYQCPKTFRSSDVTNLTLRETFVKNKPSLIDKTNPETITQKQTSTLISTLKQLEQKLKTAKKFLQNKSSQKDILGLQLCEAIQRNSEQIQNVNFWQKLQQSTINLESQKKLIKMIKSKQKIVWASKIKSYYLSQIAKGVVGINQRALQHLKISMEVLKSCKQRDLPNQLIIKRNKVNLPRNTRYQGKKVLVIDLDETLFHCQFQRNSQEDLQIDFKSDGQKGYISIRPYALSFLKRAAQHFEIISFTASEKSYADSILDEIDFQHKLIQHRLYRQHCIRLQQNVYAKDISIINRSLLEMVLVDNSPISYLYQRDNGIPILPYVGGDDNELLSLQKYLDQLRKQSDVRVLNRRTFKLGCYQQFDDCQQLVHNLYFENKDYY